MAFAGILLCFACCRASSDDTFLGCESIVIGPELGSAVSLLQIWGQFMSAKVREYQRSLVIGRFSPVMNGFGGIVKFKHTYCRTQ